MYGKVFMVDGKRFTVRNVDRSNPLQTRYYGFLEGMKWLTYITDAMIDR